MDFSIFDEAQKSLDEEQARRDQLRVVVKEMELASRKVTSEIQRIHNLGVNAKDVCTKARTLLDAVKLHLQTLKPLIPEGQYYRYNDSWKWCVKDSVFQVAMVMFLESRTLPTIPDVEGVLGFKVDLETFLLGLTQLPNELSRFCTNCVTKEDYTTPREIQSFVNELYSGFRLLNLKNDVLRKRFDSIKYDVKRIEEVVYDISIRKLGSAEAPAPEVTVPMGDKPTPMQS